MRDSQGAARCVPVMLLLGALLLNGCVVLPIGFFSRSSVFAQRQGGTGAGETITKTVTYHRWWVPFDYENPWIHDEAAKASYFLEGASGLKKRLDFLTVNLKGDEGDDWQCFLPVEDGATWMGYRYPHNLEELEFIVFSRSGVSSRRRVPCTLMNFQSSAARCFDGNRFFEFDEQLPGSIKTVRYRYDVLNDHLEIMPEALRRYEALRAMPMRMEGHAPITRVTYIEPEQYNQAKVIAGVEFIPRSLEYFSVMATNKYNEWNAFLKVRISLHGFREGEGFEGFIQKGVQLPEEKWSSRLRDHTRWERSNARPWWDPSTNDVPGMTYGQELGVDGVCYSKYEKGYLYYEAHVKKWQ